MAPRRRSMERNFRSAEESARGLASPAGSSPRRWRPWSPSCTLSSQVGRRVRSRNFRGKVQIVTFVFPYCTTYCPIIAAHFVRFERALQGAGLADRVQLLAFNVDPGGSGPGQMRAFQREYGWNPRDLRARMPTTISSSWMCSSCRRAASSEHAGCHSIATRLRKPNIASSRSTRPKPVVTSMSGIFVWRYMP
ncbi:hypothetical protein EPN52_05720 [bacterium]|nr:MAG: hypothetical protein EPN52_05720 [bacterium]